jgi:hypothetical protein
MAPKHDSRSTLNNGHRQTGPVGPVRVPFPDTSVQQGETYSITSSANVSKVGCTLMQNCFAVLALTNTQDLGWQRRTSRMQIGPYRHHELLTGRILYPVQGQDPEGHYERSA